MTDQKRLGLVTALSAGAGEPAGPSRSLTAPNRTGLGDAASPSRGTKASAWCEPAPAAAPGELGACAHWPGLAQKQSQSPGPTLPGPALPEASRLQPVAPASLPARPGPPGTVLPLSASRHSPRWPSLHTGAGAVPAGTPCPSGNEVVRASRSRVTPFLNESGCECHSLLPAGATASHAGARCRHAHFVSPAPSRRQPVPGLRPETLGLRCGLPSPPHSWPPLHTF